MQCKECRQHLSQFLDGQLDSQRQKKMQEHLKSCPDCSRALASITEMVNVMRSMQEAEPPADFLQKVNARIDSTPWWHDVLERLAGLWPQRLPMQAAAVLATLVLAVCISNQLKTGLPLRVKEDVSGQLRTAEPSCRCAIPQKAKMKDAALKQELPLEEADTTSISREEEKASAADEPRLGNNVSGKGAEYYHGVEAEEMRADKDARFRDNKEKKQLFFSGELKCDGAVCVVPRPDSRGTSLDASSDGTLRNESSFATHSGKTREILRFAEEGKVSVAEQRQMPMESTLDNEVSSAEVPVSSLSKAVVVELKEGNFIAANRQQRWTVSSSVREVTEQEMLSLLEEMRVSGIEQEKVSTAGESATLFRFTIAFRQVSILLSRLEKMGEVTLVGPLPVVRPEAYTSARGGINPKVLEELISVELTIK